MCGSFTNQSVETLFIEQETVGSNEMTQNNKNNRSKIEEVKLRNRQNQSKMEEIMINYQAIADVRLNVELVPAAEAHPLDGYCSLGLVLGLSTETVVQKMGILNPGAFEAGVQPMTSEHCKFINTLFLCVNIN